MRLKIEFDLVENIEKQKEDWEVKPEIVEKLENNKEVEFEFDNKRKLLMSAQELRDYIDELHNKIDYEDYINLINLVDEIEENFEVLDRYIEDEFARVQTVLR